MSQAKTPDEEMPFEELLKAVVEDPSSLEHVPISYETLIRLGNAVGKPKLHGCDQTTDTYDKIAVCCYNNVRAEYYKKYAVTGVISFIYQMLSEWEGDTKASRWCDEQKASEKPMELDSLIKNLELTLALAKEAKVELEKTKEKKYEFTVKQLAEEPIPNQKKEEEDIKKGFNNSYTNMFRVYHSLINTGEELKSRLDASYTEARKEVDLDAIILKEQFKDVINKYNIPLPVCKNIINQFMLRFFKYDPTLHMKKETTVDQIKKDIKPISDINSILIDSGDPDRLVIQKLKVAPEHQNLLDCITRDKQTENLFRGIISSTADCEYMRQVLDMRDIFFQYLQPKDVSIVTPPMDTFHSLSNYFNVNHHEIGNVVSALYNEKADVGACIAMCTTFEGKPSDVEEKFQKFKMRNQKDFPYHTVQSLRFGGWTPLADMKENRAVIDYLNGNTEILKRICDRADEDKATATQLMKQRTYIAKAKNIKKDGPDAAGLKKYASEQHNNAKTAHASGVDKPISAKEMRALELARGNVKKAQELELLEKYETEIEELTEKQKTVSLTDDESARLSKAKREIDSVREMIDVPDGQVQVDFFVNTGEEMERRIMYVHSEDMPGN